MQGEAADKFRRIKGDAIGFFFFTVFCGEGDFALLYFFDAVVVDGNTVGVAPKIFEDLSRPPEGAFGIDVPTLFLFGGVEQTDEGGALGEGLELTMEL